MQGIPAGFSLTAVANYLAAEGTDATAIGTFIAIVGLPWIIQFVWGPLIDRFQQSAMGRRKPWVVLAQLMAFIASLGILLVEEPSSQLMLLSSAFFVHSIFASVQDASVDAMAISIIPVKERGRINAVMRGGMLTGNALGAAGLSYMIRAYGFHDAAIAQSAALFLMMLFTFFIKEKKGDTLWPGASRTTNDIRDIVDKISLRWLFSELYKGLASSRNLVIFLSIAGVYVCLSIFIRAFSIYLIQDLQWQDTELSILSGTLGTVASLSVILVGGYLSDRYGAKRGLLLMVMVIAIFLLIFGMVSIFSTNKLTLTSGLVLWYMMDPAFSVAAFPILMALCRPKIEGSQFTTYMAMINLSDVTGSYISGYALSLLSAPVMGLICGMLLFALYLCIRQTIRKGYYRGIA